MSAFPASPKKKKKKPEDLFDPNNPFAQLQKKQGSLKDAELAPPVQPFTPVPFSQVGQNPVTQSPRIDLQSPIRPLPETGGRSLMPAQAIRLPGVATPVNLAAPPPAQTAALADPQQAQPTEQSLQDVRRARIDLSKDIRHNTIQSRNVRKKLANQVRQLEKDGRHTEAAAVQAQINQIADQSRAGTDDLRNLLELQRSLTPGVSGEQRQASRDQLNAQLPGILQSAQVNLAQVQGQDQAQLAQIGAQAVKLELGQDPSGFSEAALADFAQTASQDVIDQVTRGVGLPRVPGDALTQQPGNIQGLIDQGGVNFAPPTESRPTNQNQVSQALTFMGNQQADLAAQQQIRGNDRNIALSESATGVATSLGQQATTQSAARTAGVQGFGSVSATQGFDPNKTLKDLGVLGTGGQPDINISEALFAASRGNVIAANAQTDPLVKKTIDQIDDGSFAHDILLATNKHTAEDAEREIDRFNAFIGRDLSPQVRLKVAQSLLTQLESGSEHPPTPSFMGSFGDFVDAAFHHPINYVTDTVSGLATGGNLGPDPKKREKFALGSPTYVENQNKLEVIKNRLRSIIAAGG